MTGIIDLTGHRFGRLVVLHRVPNKSPKKTRWAVLCDCGAASEATTANLRSGKVQSCGCLRREAALDATRTHGLSRSLEARIYYSAKQRCTNTSDKKYADYGGRGIEFRFTSLEGFLAALGSRPSRRHSVDRIDNDGHYEPGNVHWALSVSQGRNKRNNVMLTFKGRTQCLAAWADETGMDYSALLGRIRLGWSDEKILSTPIKKMRKRREDEKPSPPPEDDVRY
jgi:hypothetical protein